MLRNDVSSYRSELRCMLTREGVSADTQNTIKEILALNDDCFPFDKAQSLVDKANAEFRAFIREAEVDALVGYLEARYSRETDGIPKFPAPFDKLEQKLSDIEVTVEVKYQRQRKQIGLPPPDENDNQPQE